MRHHTFETIMLAVERDTGMSRAEIFCSGTRRGMSAHRHADLLRARRALVLLLRRFTRMTFPEIAAATTGRSHSTWVGMHATAERAIDPLSAEHDPDLRMIVARCAMAISEGDSR